METGRGRVGGFKEAQEYIFMSLGMAMTEAGDDTLGDLSRPEEDEEEKQDARKTEDKKDEKETLLAKDERGEEEEEEPLGIYAPSGGSTCVECCGRCLAWLDIVWHPCSA